MSGISLKWMENVVLSVWVSDRTTADLRQLTEVSTRLAGGDFESRVILDRQDEIGDLAQALNRMADRLRAQILAQEAEREKLAAILEQMSSGVVMVDSEGEILLCNRAAVDIFALKQPDPVGASLAEALRHHQIVETWRRSMADGEALSINVELHQRGKILQNIVAPLSGVLSGNALLIFHDLTRLRQLETVRQDFVSNISHELRTPLASLKALTETLLDSALEDPPAARRFLTLIDVEVDSLSLMVQELLELARIESGRVALKIKTISPKKLVRKAVKRLVLQAERSGLQIQVDDLDGLPKVQADSPRMQQVLMNLLHNAIKFSHPGGTIRITARTRTIQNGYSELPNGMVEFQVADEGMGIPAEDLPRIFERFYKTDPARSGGGTGLGLAIAKHLVEAHGGRIWAESEEGQGSLFFFSLPVSQN